MWGFRARRGETGLPLNSAESTSPQTRHKIRETEFVNSFVLGAQMCTLRGIIWKGMVLLYRLNFRRLVGFFLRDADPMISLKVDSHGSLQSLNWVQKSICLSLTPARTGQIRRPKPWIRGILLDGLMLCALEILRSSLKESNVQISLGGYGRGEKCSR